jgi:Short C-terminal domain
MTALLLGAIALAAVVLSFSLVALTLYRVIPDAAHAHDGPDDEGGVSQTMSRVLGDVERLAALRERGALTDAEFKAQKTKVLRADVTTD